MKNIVIAISGPPGSGTTTIAKKLAEKLKLGYYSPGKTFKSYSKKKESEAALEVWEIFGKDKDFHEKGLDKVQMEKAKDGNIVVCGKLSIFILKDLADYNIWVEAPLEIRAMRTAERDKIPFEKALDRIKKREEVERESWKRFYNFDYFDQKHQADFVLDNSKLTVEQSVDRILEFINSNKK